jgi:hypothetical protein
VLERCEAIRLEEIKSAGRTRPLIIECEIVANGATSRELMLVKAFDLPEVDNYGLYAELLGNLLARELGLDTPKPTLVNLGKEFVGATNLTLAREGLQLRPGLGVGCEYFKPGFTSFIAGTPLEPEQKAQAALIYAYDLLVQNPDRLPSNPNCAIRARKLIAFDFNVAFSFLLPLIGLQPEPWEFSKLGIGTKHLFYRSLRNQAIDWNPFLSSVRRLTVKRVEELCKLMPPEWGTWGTKICDHIASIIKNLKKIELELQRSLS